MGSGRFSSVASFAVNDDAWGVAEELFYTFYPFLIVLVLVF